MQAKFISLPENNSNLRYYLGKKGKNNLLVVALNPSTANVHKHDGTSDNIEKIASVNGYDGWLLFNLSPQRTQYPYLLGLEPKIKMLEQNRHFLNQFLKDNDWSIGSVWLAWGNNINLRHYLKEEALHLLSKIRDLNLNIYCIKLTGTGHPYHPSKQSVNRYVGPIDKIEFQPFEIDSYMKKLKQN